ncbi:MAG: SDR family NAD(P)-dependent oxidoreductase [Elusimicrobia bacterium]|nr:SDR family NAD(P)-dependent oxidoreductase [Elusimicrobiota bacterium]
MSELSGKKVIVTGASKGLGLVGARALAAEGARLALLARSGDALEAARGSLPEPAAHVAISADLTDPRRLREAVERAREFLGGVDVVLHAAGGGLGLRDPLLGFDDLLKLFVLNLGVAAEINRLVVPDMKRAGRGNLVHVGSIASSEGVGSVGYNTAKAALAAYVRTLGRELAGSNIVATGILPGGFSAPQNAMERLAANNPEAYKRFVEERLPRRVMGEAKELVPMILLLCSSQASMMGGCLVPIDAGEGRAYAA